MKYIKPLDGLRAIAVMLVLVWHWLPHTYFINYFRTGPFGVDLFYVLSGFLISSILLQHRLLPADAKPARKKIMYSFYVRRLLRIFPVYYLLLFLMVLLRHRLHIPLGTKETAAALTYTSNFYLLSIHSWTQYTGHFWSLAVEEQFYLVWPWLLIFLPRKALLPCMLFFAFASVVCRWFMSDVEFGALQTVACFDALGFGALLAYTYTNHPHRLKTLYPFLAAFAVGSAALLIWHAATATTLLRQERLLHSFIGAWAVCFIVRKYRSQNVFISVLSWRPLVAVGRISYGIYLYHVVFGWQIWPLWTRLLGNRLLIPQPYQDVLIFAVDTAALFLLCAASWFFIERPVLALKSFFAYDRRPRGAKPIAAAEAKPSS